MIYGEPSPWGQGCTLVARDEALTRGVLSRRVAAFILDGIFVAILCAGLWVLLLMFGLLTLGLGLPLLGVLPAVPLFYNWLSIASGAAATPGQALMGLTVRRDADLAPPSAFEALVWTLGFIVTMALGVIWFAIAVLTHQHRTLHDLVSGLVVVRRRVLRETLTGPGIVWDAPAGGSRYV